MALIVIKVNTKEEAKDMLKKVYETDRSALFSKNGECVTGYAITALIREGIEKYDIIICSPSYSDESLLEMFGNQ